MKQNFDTFFKNIEYTIGSYKYFISSLSNIECRKLIGTHLFKNEVQVLNYEIELSWAFFTRMEAVLETFIHQIDVDKKSKKGVKNLIGEEGLKNFNKNEIEGLRLYRVIRNTLHHGDGNPNIIRNNSGLTVEDGCEIQLTRVHIHNFYKLFTKVVKVLQTQTTANKT